MRETGKTARAIGVVEDSLTFAAMTRLPAIYGFREFAEAGGLMAYGAVIE